MRFYVGWKNEYGVIISKNKKYCRYRYMIEPEYLEIFRDEICDILKCHNAKICVEWRYTDDGIKVLHWRYHLVGDKYGYAMRDIKSLFNVNYPNIRFDVNTTMENMFVVLGGDLDHPNKSKNEFVTNRRVITKV